MSKLELLNLTSWDEPISKNVQIQAIDSLEKGRILFMPYLAFPLQRSENVFLSPEYMMDSRRKNISYDLKRNCINGALSEGDERFKLLEMLKRYALSSSGLLHRIFPHYAKSLLLAKTSFRPAEIQGRKSSIHKDDTRLHVDAFPSHPTQGKRILRLFTNINPDGQPRVWQVGEPFAEVVNKFACKVPSSLPGIPALLKLLKITKETRSLYDHYMLHIHNQMKQDDLYQQRVVKEEIHFPAGSSWIVFTDQVSHAALSGRHVLEQTFYLPFNGLKELATSPLKVLETFLNRPLI